MIKSSEESAKRRWWREGQDDGKGGEAFDGSRPDSTLEGDPDDNDDEVCNLLIT